MQTIKTMFRSPRFVVGFILFIAVVLYAVFMPIINTADPKADRRDNPDYNKTLAVREAIQAKDSEAAIAAMDKLADAELSETTTSALNEARAALEAGGLAQAAKGSKQVKKTKQPLTYADFAALRDALGATEGATPDEATARAEVERLKAHYEAVMAVSEKILAGNYEEAAADITANELTEEFAAVVAMFPAVAPAEEAPAAPAEDTPAEGETPAEETPAEEPVAPAETAVDTEAIAAEVAKITTDHKDGYEKWIIGGEIIARLDAGGYADAEDAMKGIQKKVLTPNDQAPDKEFILGTDNFSRDILLEMAYGARLSLAVGLMAGCIATLIGIILGLLAGYCGGMIDNVISTVTNIFIVIPSIVVLILISVALGQMKDAWVTGLIIGLTTWPWTARAVRAQTTSLRNRDHVNMARITGYGTVRIIGTEILPYVASYVVMAFILQVAGGITSEATLAILGLGDPTAISLGRMINWAIQYEAIRHGRWWEFVPVALCIACITYGLYLMNSGMDQVFNPKIRS